MISIIEVLLQPSDYHLVPLWVDSDWLLGVIDDANQTYFNYFEEIHLKKVIYLLIDLTIIITNENENRLSNQSIFCILCKKN